MKFLKGFFVFILIAIIVGGVGYIGYSFLFVNHSAHGTTASQTQQTTGSNANDNQNQQSMQNGSTSGQTQQNTNSQSGNNQLALSQSNVVLKNKEKLDKAMALINESQRLMTLDPYAPSSSNAGTMGGMGTMQPQQQTPSATVQPAQGTTPATANPGNNTTINVFPQGNNSAVQSNTMANMGTTYDPTKMEQLHTGVYKIAVGKVLLDQLQSQLIAQAENVSSNTQDPVQYFFNQYNLTVQNKNKLNQALTYINEATNLININPYVSANGLVYDKDRMNQIHQSILRLAEGVAGLTQLNDELTTQTISLSNTAQNYAANMNQNAQQMNHAAMSTGIFGGLFDSINMSTIVNIVLILFVIGLIAGIFGFILSLFKSPVQKTNRREDEVA